MNRFSFLVLVAVVGYGGLPVKAEPVLISQVGDFDQVDPRRVEPSSVPPANVSGKLLHSNWSTKPVAAVAEKKSGKVVGKIVPSKIIPSKVKSKTLDPGTVGDFGKLPSNTYQPKQNVDGAAPPHPSDFGTVPIESDPDTRKAK